VSGCNYASVVELETSGSDSLYHHSKLLTSLMVVAASCLWMLRLG
jgi:hypothetical protein